jgi:acetylornithine aminotransferase
VVLTADVADAIVAAARDRGLLVNAVKANVLRLAPALIATEADAAEAVEILQAAVADVESQQGANA